MSGRHLTGLSFILLMMVPLISFISLGSGEDLSWDIDTDETTSNVETRSDTGPERLFSYPDQVEYGFIDHHEFVHHPNGYRYCITFQEEDGNTEGLEKGTYIIIEREDEDKGWTEIGISRWVDYQTNMEAFLDVDREGNINGVIWYPDEMGSLIEFVPISTPVDDEGNIERYVYGETRTSTEEPRRMWSDCLDGMPMVMIQDGGELYIHRMDAETEEYLTIEMGEVFEDTVDMAANDEVLCVARQVPGGEITLTTYGKDLLLIDEHTLVDLLPGSGVDNRVSLFCDGSNVEAFIYLDELLSDRYSTLEYIVLDLSSEAMTRKSVTFPEGVSPFPNGGPMKVLGGYYFIVHNGSTIMQYDENMQYVTDHYLQEELYHSSAILESWYSPFEDQAFFYCIYKSNSGSTSLRGFCSYDPNSVPELGVYILPDNTVLVGVDLLLHYPYYIDIGHTLTLIDSTLTMGAGDRYYYGLDLINDGTLILINSTIIGNNSKSIFDLPGSSSSLYMYDSYLDIDGEIEGYFEAHGERMFYNYRERDISLNDCDAIIEGLDLNLGVVGDPQYSRDELFNMVGDVTLTFEGCRLESIFQLITGDDSFVSFHNCSLKEITRLVYDESYYGYDNVDIRNVINTTFNDVGMIEFTSERVENCKFIDCDDLTLRGNSRDDLSVINCEFIGIHDPIELESGGNLRIINCLFSDFDNAVYVEYIGEILISNTTFQGGEWGIYTYHFDTFIIEDCTFEDLNISIYIDEDEDYYSEGPNSIHIENNLFLRDNLSIFYRPDNPYDFDDYYSYDYGDNDIRYDIQRYDGLDFLDCRYNTWEDEDPNVVAGKISPGIYFLPYYTPDGTEISTSDNDMDGMDDDWEERNHLDNLYYFDRYLDPDRDYYSNYEEYRTGADPFDNEDSPGKHFWSPALVLGLIFTILLTSLIISYLFYIQRAMRKERMVRFEKVYAAHHLKMRAMERKDGIEPKDDSLPHDQEEKEPLSPDGAAGPISEDGAEPGQKAEDTKFKVVEAKVITTPDEEVTT